MRASFISEQVTSWRFSLQEVASVDDMKLTVTARMYITMTWKDERIVYTATDKDDEDVYLVGNGY